MSGLINMVNEIKGLLNEVKMKNIFEYIGPDDVLLVHFKHDTKDFGDFQRFVVVSKNQNGILMVAEKDKKGYTLNKNNLSSTQIGIGDEATGKIHIFFISNIAFRINKLGPEIVRLNDVDEPPIKQRTDDDGEETPNDGEKSGNDREKNANDELNAKKDKFNEIIKDLSINNNLIIKTSVPNEDGTIDDNNETIFTFSLNKIDNEELHFTLTWIEGAKSKGYREHLNNKRLKIIGNNLIKINKTILTLDIYTNDGHNINDDIFTLLFIRDVAEGHLPDEPETMSKARLSKIIKNDETILKLFNTQPNLINALMGASPTGIYQLSKLLQKYKINNTYLTKNKHVKFKLLSGSIGDTSVPNGHLINAKKRSDPYTGVMITEKIIKCGTINQIHLEIELIKNYGDGVYDVKIKLHTGNNNIQNYGTGKIEIIDITK